MDKKTKNTDKDCGSALMTGYKRVAWSRSMSEEVISALWCIVAILAYGFDVGWLMWYAGLKAVSDQLIAIYIAIKEVRDTKIKIAEYESL